MTVGLQLHLLGTAQIIVEGRPLAALTSAKAQALLFYLATTGRSHARAALASLLWGDVPDAAARANLRKALQQLREHLTPWLVIGHDDVALACDSRCWVDVIEFDAVLGDANGGDIDRLRSALDLYVGDFLQGFYVRRAPDFEEWWLREQARLREQALDGLNRLAEQHAARSQLDQAIGCARRFLALEPSREELHRRLMFWLAQDGQRGAALAQYEICRQTLAGELDVEPAAETTALYERIRDGDLASPSPALEFLPVMPQRPAFLDGEGRTRDAIEARLVGRDRQLARLAEILDVARSAQGQVAFASGEAGSGKTSLLVEFSRRAQARDPDLIVASGVCTTSTGAGDPYLPFREILEMLTADVEQKWTAGTISHRHALALWRFLPQVIEALITRGRHLIGSLLPGEMLLQRAAAHEAVDGSAVQQVAARTIEARDRGCAGDQERIFEEVGDVLQALAAQKPLLLILDDLHWADASSINLLFHLGRRLVDSRVLILGAYRPEEVTLDREGHKHLLADPLNEFRRTFGDVWVNLDEVPPEEGRAFVDALIDVEPNRLGDEFRAALCRHTAGHPLFTVETLRDMRERGDLSLDELGQWVAGANLEWNSLPARVEGVIEMRVRRLDANLHRILAVASVAGETFAAQAVAHVCGVDERELVRVLDRDADARHRLAQEQGIKRVGGQRFSIYRFRHNLFQRYLYSQLSESEREFLHEDVGNALEHLYGENRNQIAVELAYHFQAAGDSEKAVDYLFQAGNQAIQLSAHEEAVVHLMRALELLSTLPASPAHDLQELRLRISLGEARRFAGQIPAALETFERSAAIARELGAAHDLARAALGFEEARWRYHLPPARAVELLQEALPVLGQEEGVLRVRILGSLVRALMASGEPSELEAMAEQAIRAARRLNDPVALYDTLRIYLFANRQPDRIDERVATADEMVRLAEASGSQERIGEALGSRIHEHLEKGDIPSLDEDLELHARVVEALRQPFFQHTHAMFRAARMLLEGDFAEGERLARQALHFGQRLETENVDGVFGLQMFTIRREQGRLREMAPLVKHFVEQRSASATWRPGLALIYSDLGMEQEARTEFEHLAADDLGSLPWDALRPATLAYLSEVCAFLGDKRRAAALYRLLLPYHGQNIVIGFAAACYGAASRYLGLLAATLSRWDEAENHFHHAIEMNTRMGARPWLAHTQYQYAAMLLARDRQGDGAKALSLVDRVLITAGELGMRALVEKAETLKRAPPRSQYESLHSQGIHTKGERHADLPDRAKLRRET